MSQRLRRAGPISVSLSRSLPPAAPDVVELPGGDSWGGPGPGKDLTLGPGWRCDRVGVEEAEAAAAEGERRWREYKRRLLLRRSQNQSSWYVAERGKVSALVGGLHEERACTTSRQERDAPHFEFMLPARNSEV